MIKKSLPHFIAVTIFLVVAMVYCKPAMEGKVLQQPDIMYWKAMAQSSFKYKETHGHFPLWTNSMFCGMPAYFIAMDADNPASLTAIHSIFMEALPKPVCFFFLLCMGMYMLGLVLKIDSYICILGGVAYAYASYSCIIIAVGHETKVLSMAYGPALLAAILLVYKKKYWLGGALTILFSSLLIAMAHIQVTYYFVLTALILTIFYSIRWVRNKEFSHLFKCLSIAAVAGILGICTNMVTLATAYDYSKATRNGSLNMNDSIKVPPQSAGYSMDYAFNWSYGIKETYTLLIPDIFGGKTSANLPESSRFIRYFKDKKVNKDIPVQDMVKDWPQYWGDQPSTSGPVYAGAIICLLFLLGIISMKGIDKWWMLTAIIITVFMAWGKHFPLFNTFIFNHLPFYNKFRAPSMTLIIPQLLMPLLAMCGLQKFLYDEDDKQAMKHLRTTGVVMLILLSAAFYFYTSFTYKGVKDAAETITYIQQATTDKALADGLYKAFLEDRKILFGNDLLRSSVLISLAFLLLWFAKKYRVKPIYLTLGLFLLSTADLLFIGKRYLNADNYQDAKTYNTTNYAPTKANTEILKDTGFFRVLDRATYSDARTYYYHNSVEGYSPATLTVIQDLLTNQKNNPALNNMLNAKYIIRFNKDNEPEAEINAGALGNCWLVKSIQFADGPVAAMKAMNNFNPKEVAVVEEEYRTNIPFNPIPDSTASIKLIKNDNDIATYYFTSATNQFAVFSEVYYSKGWKAYIDNKETAIIKTDYALRGLAIPPGQHAIRFEFKPASYYNSLFIAKIASVIGWLAILLAFLQQYREYRKSKKLMSSVLP